MDSPHQFSPNPNPKSPSTLFLTITVATSVIILSAIAYFLYHFYYSLLHRSRTTPFDAAPPPPPPPPFNHLRRFSYRDLKISTNNFSSSNFIGKGGSGTVYRGLLKNGKLVAVKLLDSSYQSEMEFQNELKILGGIKPCRDNLVVNLLGFCVEKEKRLVVYEYMCNKSLQECLFADTDLGLNWSKRFRIILDVAKALAFLHLECDPPVIHGDVKPSNVLLDSEFRAKISDFGLSRLKIDGVAAAAGDDGDGGESPVVENDEVDFALALQASSSSKSSCKIYNNVMGFVLGNDPMFNLSGSVQDDDKSGDLNSVEIDRSIDLNLSKNEPDDMGVKQWGKDWWWRQDGSGELCSKDYVMEWIGSQICANPDDWDEEKGAIEEKISSVGVVDNCSNPPLGKSEELVNDDTVREGLDNDIVDKGDSIRWSKKHRKIHEWWKEERMDEVQKKKGRRNRFERVKVPHFGLAKCFDFKRIRKFGCKNRAKEDDDYDQNMEFSFRKGWRKKNNNNNSNDNNDNNNNKSRSMGSEMWSGDLFSRELSSTTSMRGTLCYVAPEYSGFGYLMEKADIYSFGVLVLVIISGRRPLHVLSSPMKLEQANLISWSRSLAQTGNVLELVDQRLGDEYCKDEAELCINLALACLQKMPELRPDIGEVVRVLRREMDPRRLPLEFSPPPPPGKGFGRARRKHHKISTVD